MILVDTSIWVEMMRKVRPLDLEAIVNFDEVVTCLPVVQEVLQGIRDDRAFRTARDAMENLPHLDDPLTNDTVLHAVDLYRAARKRGLTIRSPVDCLVAAIALRYDAEVLHRDRDYRALARISTLRQREPS